MGLCYSLRSRLAAAHPSVPYGGRGEADPAAAEQQQQCGDPQVRHRLRQDLVAKERADKKRSKSIDKTLKAEKREYKQTHRLLLLGERGAGGGGEKRAAAVCLPLRAGRTRRKETNAAVSPTAPSGRRAASRAAALRSGEGGEAAGARPATEGADERRPPGCLERLP